VVFDLQLTATEPRPDCRVIAVEGELDLAVADQLREALDGASAYRVVLVDLGSCEFLDSTGLAVLVNASNARKAEEKRLALFGANHQVLRVLSVTGLTDNGLVFGSLEEALGAG
jgi:anti-anti-sigma factor